MERYPKRFKEKEAADFAEYVAQNTIGVNILESEPTNADLKPNTINKYGNNIYIKFSNNITLKFTADENVS